MAYPANGTKLANLFDPQVVAALVEKKLTDAIKFAPLCRVDTTLVGRPGSTVTLPSYAYIGDAEAVAEGADIPLAKLTESTATVSISKVGKAVQITDEAVLSGFGDPIGEAVSQIRKAIASKVDNDIMTILGGIAAAKTFTTSAVVTAFSMDDVADALVLFGEDIDGAKVILVSPEQYNVFRKADDWCPASEIAASILIRGAIGMVHGCQVIVSNKLSASKNAYIVKPGALALYMKRDTFVETDRDILNKSTVIAADKHYAGYLYDASKAIKMVLKTG